MRVLVVGSYAPSLLNFRGPLIRRLIAKGHEVCVTAPDIGNEIRGILEAMGAQVFEINLTRNETDISGDLFYCWSLFRLIKDTWSERVLTYTIKPNIWGAFAAKLAGVPSVAMVTGLGFTFPEAGTKSGLKTHLVAAAAQILYRLATSFNHRVIFQNQDDVEDFIKAKCLSDRSKVAFMNGSGVDLSHYQRADTVSEPIFLMISRLLKSKGVREYVEAIRIVKSQYKDAYFILVGPLDGGPDGLDESWLKPHLDERLFEYLGYTDDVRPILARAAIYVLPSYREGTPRSVLEAMAMGRAIITSNAPGCRDTIIDGEHGFLVPVRDSDALAAAMISFIKNPQLAKKMGLAANRRAAEKYDVTRVNEQVMQTLGLFSCEVGR